jgi:hypothetical protein
MVTSTQEQRSPGGAASSNPTESSWTQVDPAGHIERAGFWLICLPETLGWYYRYVYTGHTLKDTGGEWLLVVRATDNGRKRVCFTGGATPVDCVRSLAWAVRCRTVQWKEDLY